MKTESDKQELLNWKLSFLEMKETERVRKRKKINESF